MFLIEMWKGSEINKLRRKQQEKKICDEKVHKLNIWRLNM